MGIDRVRAKVEFRLAEVLEMDQGNISKLEKRIDNISARAATSKRWCAASPNPLRQRHIRCQRGLAVEKIGKSGAAHLQELCCLGHAEAESFDDLGPDQNRRDEADSS
jgi:hypothetical protein